MPYSSNLFLVVSLLLGLVAYQIARGLIGSIEARSGKPAYDSLLDDERGEDPYLWKYAFSATLTALGAKLIFDLVSPMGWNDHYAILLDAALLVFLVTGVILGWVDAETQILPTTVIYTGGAAALILLIAAAAVIGNWELLILMAVGGVFFFVWYAVFWFFNAMGLGDVRLSFFLGAILAFFSIPTAIVGLLAPYFIYALVTLIKAPFGMIERKFAFGPWMILGAFVGLLWGPSIVMLIL